MMNFVSRSISQEDKILAARALVAKNRGNMNSRLISSERIITACEQPDLNKDFFENNKGPIGQLVANTSSLSEAIKTLSGEDCGMCDITRTIPGRFYGKRQVVKKESVATVNSEIQSNLDKEVVKTALRTIAEVKAPRFTMPGRPSNKTLVKAGVGATITGSAIGAYTLSDSDAMKTAKASAEAFMADAMNKTIDFSNYVKSAVSSFTAETTKPSTYEALRTTLTEAYEKAATFLGENQTAAIGVGALASTAIAGGLAYKVVQNRKARIAAAVAANLDQNGGSNLQKTVEVVQESESQPATVSKRTA